MKRREVLVSGWKLLVAGSIFATKAFPFSKSTLGGLRAILKNNARMIYVKKGSLYKSMFTEQFESVLFLFSDGEFYVFTTQEERCVGASIDSLIGWLKKEHDLKDLVIVVHNHFPPGSFSQKDKQSCACLRKEGFVGKFLVFHTASGKVEELKD